LFHFFSSALVGHSLHLPLISICAFQLIFYLLAYNQKNFFAALVWSTLWQRSLTSNSGYILYNAWGYLTASEHQMYNVGVTWSVLTTDCTVLLHWRRRSDW
jgi:hypothetical protein